MKIEREREEEKEGAEGGRIDWVEQRAALLNFWNQQRARMTMRYATNATERNFFGREMQNLNAPKFFALLCSSW